jgi:hypothetical protein
MPAKLCIRQIDYLLVPLILIISFIILFFTSKDPQVDALQIFSWIKSHYIVNITLFMDYMIFLNIPELLNCFLQFVWKKKKKKYFILPKSFY